MRFFKGGLALWPVVAVLAWASAAPSFLFAWGIVGHGGGQFLFPVGLAVGPQDQVVVTDVSQHRVQLFDAQGRFLRQWGTKGSGPGQLDQPQDAAVDGRGTVYVSDANNGRIQAFDLQGNFLASFGRLGPNPGEFNLLRGLGLDAQGNVYAADLGNGRVQKFDGQGRLAAVLGRGVLQDPADVAVDAEGNLYVLELNRGLVVVLRPDGTPLRSWGKRLPLRPDSLKTPQNLALDPATGWVYVSDSGHHRVVVFTPEGQVVASWGSRCHLSFLDGCVDPDGSGPLASGDGQFLQPRGIGVNSQGSVYVTDMFNHRVEAFGSR